MQKSQRFESLDAMRGIAALFVALVHFPAIFAGASFAPLRHTYILTNLFFALSGFILMAAYGSKLKDWAGFKSFATARVYRLVPLHLITTVAILLVPYVAYFVHVGVTWLVLGTYAGDMPNFPINWEHVGIHLLMLQGFNLVPQLILNFPAWSMGAVFFCSLIFAAITVFAKGIRLWIFALLSLAGFYAVAFLSPTFLGASHDYGFARAVTSFFAGALTHAIWTRWAPSEKVQSWAPLYQTAALALFVWYSTWVGVNSPTSLWAPLVFLVLMLAFAMDRGDYARFFKHPAFKWLSERSFSIFMNQACLLFIGHQAEEWIKVLNLNTFDGLVVGTAAALLYVGLLLWISNWTYHNIELRFNPKKAAQKSGQKPSAARSPSAKDGNAQLA